MAKRVVIGDLVVKVGVESKSAAREMRKLKKDLENFDKANKKSSDTTLRSTKQTTSEVEKQGKIASKNRRRAARERAAVERHQRRVLKYQQSITRAGSKAAGKAAVGVAGGGIAAVGIAGAAAIAARNSMRQLRIAENVHRVAYLNRGMSEEDVSESRDKLYRRSLPYGLDPAQLLKVSGDFASTMGATTAVIEDFVTSAGVISKVYGLNQQQMGGFFTGSRQFFSGAMDWDNVKQLFENVGISAKEMADALGVTQAEFLKQGAEGNIRALVEKAGGINTVFIKLTEEMSDTALNAFNKVNNTLPVIEDLAAAFLQNSVRIFGEGMEKPYIAVLKDLTTFMQENGPAFKAAGEAVGVGMEVLWQGLKEFLGPFQEDIDKWVEAWNKMDEVARKEYITQLADQVITIAKGFAIAFSILKALDIITEIAKIKRAFQILAGTSAAAGTVTSATAGGASAATAAGSVLPFLKGLTGVGAALYSSKVGEGSDILPGQNRARLNLPDSWMYANQESGIGLSKYSLNPAESRANEIANSSGLLLSQGNLNGSNVTVTVQDSAGEVMYQGAGETTIFTTPTAE